MTKKNLKGLDLAELQLFVEELGEKKYRAAQLYGWPMLNQLKPSTK